MTFVYGPITIPPGHDLNRLSAELPVRSGFLTNVTAKAIDSASLEQPTNMVLHIHHFLWYHKAGPEDDADIVPEAAFVFGSGEERTRFDADLRSRAAPGGPRYGMFVDATTPQAFVFMLHNKVTASRTVYIVLDVTFVDGTAAEIAAASDCVVLLDGERCAAGETFHGLKARMWGPANYQVPRGNGRNVRGPTGANMITMSADGTIVMLASHLHAEGQEVIFVNMGPAGSTCGADLDRDGWPGVTILRSKRVERFAASNGHSEEFQMEVTHPAWRAPVKKGDRIGQIAIYNNQLAAAYDAMSITAILVDRESPPPARSGACAESHLAASLVGGATGDPRVGVLSRDWDTPVLPHCGPGFAAPCEPVEIAYDEGEFTDTVQIAGFAYIPGDRGFAGNPLGAIPKVRQGQSLRFVNDDGAGVIRHTVTSCAWPCDGAYHANYPVPDGQFDSRRLMNLDPLDFGGPTSPEATPIWETPKTLSPGLYSYYCRLHPFMRGAFEVVAN